VTYDEAAAILGVTTSTVTRLVQAGRLTRHRKRYKHAALSRLDVEALAAQTCSWYRAAAANDSDSYWVTGQRAAGVLGVNRARLGQLADAGRLPFLAHRDGTRLFRRHQLEVIANARAQKAPSGVRAW
jgi:excisionase family DNA binding protein